MTVLAIAVAQRQGQTLPVPHVNALIHLTVAHAARYTDSLRAGGSLRSDKGRFSLDSLLNMRRIEDLLAQPRSAHSPAPSDVWEELRREWVEWPPLLSMKFPHLQHWDEKIIRLAEGCNISGLDPSIRPGSCVLLEKAPAIPGKRSEVTKTGWSRPLYMLRKGMKHFCGYVEREGNQYVAAKLHKGLYPYQFHFGHPFVRVTLLRYAIKMPVLLRATFF